MTYFDCCKVPLIAHGMDLLEQGVIQNKTDFEFAKDIYQSVLCQYAHFDAQTCHKIAEYGDFFPTLLADPSVYIIA